MKTKYLGHELRAGVTVAAHKICAALGLRPVNIVWSADTQTASMSQSSNLSLADVADDAVLPVAIFNRYVGYIIHELLHRKYTDFSAVGSAGTGYIAELHNAVEDIWIERKGIAAGLTGNIEGLLTELINGMVCEAIQEVSDWSNPAQYPFALAVTGREYANPVPIAVGLTQIFIDASTRIDACTNSYDTLAVAQWVMKQLGQLPKPKPSQPGNKPGDQSDKPGQQAGQATAPTNTTVAMPVEPTNAAPVGSEGVGGCYSAAYAQSRDRLHVRGKPFYDTTLVGGGALKYSVKRLFENTGRDEFQGNRKSGSINSAALASTGTGNVRVFKRRIEADGIDSAVVILLDVSGSMDETNKPLIPRAIKTAAALVETLSAAGVNVALVSFASTASVIKHFEGSARRAIQDLACLSTHGSTNDYESVRLCHEMLHRRSEARKVLFVITDGVGNVHETTAQVASGVRLGITTIGIGLDLDIKSIYPNSITVRDMDELASASFKQIKLAA